MLEFLKILRNLGVLGIAWCMTGAASPDKGSLIIEVTGFRNAAGGAPIVIFDGDHAASFPGKSQDARARRYLGIAPGGSARWEITDLPFGSYAVILFHDEDANGELATNFLGIPKEGLAISNNFKPRFGPPTFDDARFDFTRSEQVIRLGLQY